MTALFLVLAYLLGVVTGVVIMALCAVAGAENKEKDEK